MSVYATDSYKNALARLTAKILKDYPEVGDLKGKTVLITGSTGQIGTAFVYLMASIGKIIGDITIFAGCRNKDKFMQRFTAVDYPGIRYFYFDATRSINYDEEIDYVVHCAGYGDPSSFVNDPVGVMRANFYGVDNVLHFLESQHKGKMLYISSGEVYGQVRPGMSSFTEDYISASIDTMNYRSCYPIAKKAGETLCASYCSQHGVDAVVARQCHVFGPGFSEKDSRVTAELLTKAAHKENLILHSSGSQVRSYLFELDACCAYLALLLRGKPGEAYNISPAYTVSIRELAEKIAKIAQVSLSFDLDESENNENRKKGYGGIARSVLDSSKLRLLGWNERFSFDEAVKLTLESLR